MKLPSEIENAIDTYRDSKLDLLENNLKDKIRIPCNKFYHSRMVILHEYINYFDYENLTNTIKSNLKSAIGSVSSRSYHQYDEDKLQTKYKHLLFLKKMDKYKIYLDEIKKQEQKNILDIYQYSLSHENNIKSTISMLGNNEYDNRSDIKNLKDKDEFYLERFGSGFGFTVDITHFHKIHFFTKKDLLSEIQGKLLKICQEEKYFLKNYKLELKEMLKQQKKKNEYLDIQRINKKYKEEQALAKKKAQQKKERERIREEQKKYKELAKKKAQEEKAKKAKKAREERHRKAEIEKRKKIKKERRDIIEKNKLKRINAEKKAKIDRENKIAKAEEERQRREYELKKQKIKKELDIKEKLEKQKIEAQKAAEIEKIKLEREKLRIENEREERVLEQARIDAEIFKLQHEKEMKENETRQIELKYLREQAQLKGIHSNIQNIKDFQKKS